MAMSRLLRGIQIVVELTSDPKFFSNGCETDNAANACRQFIVLEDIAYQLRSAPFFLANALMASNEKWVTCAASRSTSAGSNFSSGSNRAITGRACR
jgi:hypothetical protein